MIRLTKKQAELLEHRLTAEDALVEVFEGHYAEEDVRDACEDLLLGLAHLEVNEGALTPISRAVLIDAVEGSTWVQAFYYESVQAHLGAIRVAEAVVAKFADHGLPLRGSPCR